MYEYLKGLVTAKQIDSYRGTYIVLDVNGVGYFIKTTSGTVAGIKDNENEIKIYVSLVHREDQMLLCGFLTKEERDIFNILQSVSGVGVKLALLLLDEFSVAELINLVVKSDYKGLSAAKGVGPKLAQKIVLELKDKLINWSNVTPLAAVCSIDKSNISDDCLFEAQSVLLSLGYSQSEASESIKSVLSLSLKNSEEVLKASLEYLAQK